MKTIQFKSFIFLICIFSVLSCVDKETKSNIENNSKKLDTISKLLKNSTELNNTIGLLRLNTVQNLIPSDEGEKFPAIYLNADFSKEIKQHLHIDLVGQFGIIAHSKLNADGKMEMEVILREIDDQSGNQRNTLDLKSAKYVRKLSEDGKILHHIYLKIDKTNSSNDEVYTEVQNIANFKPKKGEIINIHINGKSSNLDILTNYGQQFCKSIIIAP